MLRFVTIFFIILVTGVSAGLYHVKYSVDRMERRAMALKAEIAEEQEAISLLEAEWSALNRPERLQKLSDRFLDLRPIEATQIAGFADLPARVPDLEGTDSSADVVGVAPRIRPDQPKAAQAASVAAFTPVVAPPRQASVARGRSIESATSSTAPAAAKPNITRIKVQ